jgi:hypothetical protein
MHKADQWNDQLSFYRFFSNERVKEEALIRMMGEHCKTQCLDKHHLLLIEDTTELNMEKHRQRIRNKGMLGLAGNNTDLGFFCHSSLVVDPSDASLTGVIDAHLWHREEDKQDKNERDYKNLPFEEKESWRWAERAIDCRRQLQAVETVTVVQDREGDIYESFCLLRQSDVHFVIRSAQDRLTAEGKLRKDIHAFPALGQYSITIADNKKRKKREAILEVRYGTIELKRPQKPAKAKAKEYPPTLSVQIVYVKEIADSVPDGEEPVEWILYTSHPVNNLEDARQILYFYQLRWLIEDLHRTLKSEGVNYESSELESGKALRKLLVLALMAAVQILQLRQARNGNTYQKPSLVFSNEQLNCLEDLLPRFEGKTEKLKNPFSRNNLAWAAWIIARLGGWKGYASQRPPGVIIFREGWIRFQNIFEGWIIAKDVYKR